MEETKYYRFEGLLQQQGWMFPAFAGVKTDGTISYLSENPPSMPCALEAVNGYALPGFPNAHSHAFQYAMAGHAERHQPGTHDDFWTWREAMYQCALSVNPDQMEAIAAMLYAEMLRNGYTHVAEFHYLHNDADGRPYDNAAEMGERLLAAASAAGIRITLIPVMYQKGGFGKEPTSRQRRFLTQSVEKYFRLLEKTQEGARYYHLASTGFGVHSLRAVAAPEVVNVFNNGPRDLPFHMHAAEQLQEVEDCNSYLGARPVEWIVDNLPANERINLVHCTHLSEGETEQLAKSRTNVILCPSTEGNLGDGIFNLRGFNSAFGSWAIGTDSQIGLNPLEDLRWLDYTQRLRTHRRNTFDDAASLFVTKIITGGRRAMGIASSNFFEQGQPFDAVIFDAASPLLLRAGKENLLSVLMYTADSSAIEGTIVNGKWVVRKQHHRSLPGISQKYKNAIREIS